VGKYITYRWHILSVKCLPKNYWNRTTAIKIIVGRWVVYFLEHTVYKYRSMRQWRFHLVGVRDLRRWASHHKIISHMFKYAVSDIKPT